MNDQTIYITCAKVLHSLLDLKAYRTYKSKNNSQHSTPPSFQKEGLSKSKSILCSSKGLTTHNVRDKPLSQWSGKNITQRKGTDFAEDKSTLLLEIDKSNKAKIPEKWKELRYCGDQHSGRDWWPQSKESKRKKQQSVCVNTWKQDWYKHQQTESCWKTNPRWCVAPKTLIVKEEQGPTQCRSRDMYSLPPA